NTAPGAGVPGRPGMPGFKGRLPLEPRFGPVIPQMQVDKLHMEMTINGAKIVRKQDGPRFSGEYSKDGLKITLEGKIENGRATPGEVTVTEGRETKKYASPKDVPV